MSGKRTSAGWADADGITLRRSRHEPVTVTFDDQMVWAVDPARSGTQSVVGVRLPWPAGLAPYLQGRTRVRVRSSRSDSLLVDAEVAFDDSEGRVRVTDRQGRPLMLNKVGTLGRAHATVDDAIRREALQHSRDLIDLLQDAGVDAFLNYGALLGAVRENGRLISHDNDIDLVYLSRHDHPADVIAESWRLERVVRASGLGTIRMSGGDFKVRVR
ncbi:MAG: class I SAM-dependent methyltransferase, partial [Myxococcales bacterium]